MEGVMNRETVKELIKNVQVPVVLKNICNWPLLNWTLDDWEKQMPSGNLAFRCNPVRPTREPCWERNCQVKDLPFKKFIDIAKSDPKDWFYFDYKYVHQWFKADSEFSKQIKWDAFGFPEAGASESTLWVGSRGAHTPCHQDTYGRNIVLQVYGSKRWLLFPPDCGGMKPTRVPYEESSIYSQLNFHLPTDLTVFGGISGCRMVVLEPGDVLVVPNRWWHYVEHVSQIGITINSWIPTEDLDAESRVGEAITRLIVAQICKDLPEKCLPYILNPNEDDLQDIPLSVNLLQVESTVVKCLAQRPKKNPAKRIKLSECENSTNTSSSCSSSGDAAGISNSHKESKTTTDKVNMVEGNQIITDKVIAVEKNNRTTDKVIVVEKNRINIDKVIGESGNHILVVKEISKSDLLDILNENIKNNFSKERTESWSEDEENNGELKGDHFTSAIIRAISQPTVIENIKNNLLNSFT